MSVRGGYQIIDLQHTNFSSGSPSAIPGTYAAIEASHKRINIENLVISDTEYKPMTANFIVDASNFVAELTSKISISVAENDEVTVTVSE